ncbi:MAG TPA: hypothetical protein DEQ34_14865 [Balneolaceae bacterium]|nr:hypothetical protein [Balneolaceae bacterium]|tara:strand:+ start:100896 stop:101276 length:381 start_codon:yes stop_codon:yes gene_type:complete
MKGKTPKDVDEYISWQSEEFRKNLIECRNYIRDLVPEAEEMISYQIPTYKLYYMLVGFGVTKKYCSFYTMSPDLIKRMEKDLKNIKYSGATLYFKPGQKIPKALIKKIIKARIKENKERAKEKGKI